MLTKMACKTATQEARNLNARVKLNDLFILSSAEFLNTELDMGFGEGHLSRGPGLELQPFN